MDSEPLLVVRPTTRSFVLFSIVDVLTSFVSLTIILFGMSIAFMSSASFLKFFWPVILVALLVLFIHAWSASRQAKTTHITFSSDKIEYSYVERMGKQVSRRSGSLSYADVQRIDVSRGASDWLFGTGTIFLTTAESKSFLFFRIKTPTVPHVLNPFEVRAQIDRILAERAKIASSAQSSQ